MPFYEFTVSDDDDWRVAPSISDAGVFEASTYDANGLVVRSKLDLNTCIGASNGKLVWGGKNFMDAASDMFIFLDGMTPTLRATLFNDDGEEVITSINLDERLCFNQNAQLAFMENQ